MNTLCVFTCTQSLPAGLGIIGVPGGPPPPGGPWNYGVGLHNMNALITELRPVQLIWVKHTYHITSWRWRRIRSLQKYRSKSWKKCITLTCSVGCLWKMLTELEFGGFGQGLPPPGPLERTQTHTQTFGKRLCFQIIWVGSDKLSSCLREVMITRSTKKNCQNERTLASRSISRPLINKSRQ